MVSPVLSEWRSVLVIITFSTLADITVLLDDLQCRDISIVSDLYLTLGIADPPSLTVWIFHMFVHGFGTYKVFLEIQCKSPRSIPRRTDRLLTAKGCPGGSSSTRSSVPQSR